MEQILWILLVLAAAGALAGFMAGLLGIGGGIVMVPILFSAFALIDAPEAYRMHLTVATSLGVMIPTAIVSSLAHRARGAVEGPLVRTWGPWVVLGATAGAAAGSAATSDALVAVFTIAAFLMGVKLLIPYQGWAFSEKFPFTFAGRAAAFAIAGVSALMGIGGATFVVPALTLFTRTIHTAVGTSAVIGVMVAAPAAAAYVWGGLGAAGLPAYSLGFVSLPAVAVVSPLAMWLAPRGAALAHHLSHRRLAIVFGVFLIASALRMAYPLVAS